MYKQLLLVITLVSAIFIVVFLRFWQLGGLPYTINADEASFGYEAYSISQIGKDTFGLSYPLFFRSYGDQKAPALVYSSAVLLKFFPLSPFVTRFFSALSTTLLLGFVYLILRKLKLRHYQALIVTLLLGISPWLNQMGREYYEASGGLLWVIAQLALYITSFTKSPKIGLIATALGAFAGYWYPPYFLISWGVLLVYLLVYKSRNSLWHILILFVLTLPLILNSGKILTRSDQESIKRNEEISHLIDEQRRSCYLSHTVVPINVCYWLWNKPIMRATQVTSTYLTMLLPHYLAFPNNTTSLLTTQSGAYPYTFAIFYLLGIYFVYKNYRNNHALRLLVLAYLGTTLVAASPGIVSLHRNMPSLIIAAVLSGYGVSQSWEAAKSMRHRVGLLVLGVVFIFQILQSTTDYYLVAPVKSFATSDYNTRQLIAYLGTQKDGAVRPSYYSNSIYAGPTLYSFATALKPEIYAESVIYSPVNQFGNLWAEQVAGYQTTGVGELQFVCSNLELAVAEESYLISPPNELLKDFLVYATTNPSLLTPELSVYNLTALIKHLQANPKEYQTLCQ